MKITYEKITTFIGIIVLLLMIIGIFCSPAFYLGICIACLFSVIKLLIEDYRKEKRLRYLGNKINISTKEVKK